MASLVLERPLVFFDLETTGTDPFTDRIVEIALLGWGPDGQTFRRSRRIHPERPIPPEATAVHGIRDEDVRDAPPFRRVARGLLEFIGAADLAGFNIRRFDLPLLEREFRDCGLDLGSAGRRIIDVMTIFHRMERRDLAAAVRFYLGRDLAAAHSAEADVAATAEVLGAQLERYSELPRTVDALDRWLRPPARPGALDAQGKFVWRGGEAVLAFGKHQGKALREIARDAPDYLQWIEQSDFPEDARAIARGAREGRFPGPPSSEAPSDQST
jgi:DNA polymerase-3 subunit epsilon